MKLFDEFNKLIVFAVMMTYFYGVYLGGEIAKIHPEYLGELLLLIGTATTTVISFYCWKARGQNIASIEKEVNGYGQGLELTSPGGEEEVPPVD